MPKRVSVLEVCVRRLGVHRGALAAANVAQFVMATYELGHVPTIVEYSDWWAISERSGWRHASRVEAVFGEDWRSVVEQIAGTVEARLPLRDVQKLPLPVALASA